MFYAQKKISPVKFILRLFYRADWILIILITPILFSSLATMKSFGGGKDYFFNHQIIWIAIGIFIFVAFNAIDWRFFKRGNFLFIFYIIGVLFLIWLIFYGKSTKGAVSWLKFPLFSIEPSEPIKLLMILILAKYFSLRHIEIAHIKHIIVSGTYAALPSLLIFLQPDFGSAAILFFIWLGMIIVSGVSKKHLLAVLLLFSITFALSWFFVLKPYQKLRIITFVNPLSDPKGAGYNALQSTIAVGSGRLWGKGIGLGAQSRLNFLPEPETDFIFASFAEEWGFLGVVFIFIFFAFFIWRILNNAFLGMNNFQYLYGIGLSIFFMTHFIINVGMNIGILPITGITLPFMSYGGSNLITSFAGIGILSGMRK
ncbi:MAG: rod shape-determining protein RodA [Candidatus Tagabacteria bacterium RIFCSPLOWO2_01_FULL_39_11]|uniref:Rod shape-determining protein RodA n=1 Tax=Candidatus Tagabacteria bacterium RIFCSPLOWO2_01_FULL_39_11 TaxID=1802295 RepID=A0A1G2LS21_9BACT|nr:MAG: rod shape-determining protein RodA [Candidatus Tagabacteria bacterium RIFCSPLOWO2_01_FULL_39_11]